MATVPVRSLLRAQSFGIANASSASVSTLRALSLISPAYRRGLVTANHIKSQTSWCNKTYINPITSRCSRSQRAAYSTNSTTPPHTEETDDTMADSEPTGLIAKKGIELLTFSTPNGYKASILLEELKEAYGLEYTWQSVNIMKNTQKEPWFTAICPNGRIPAIVDHDRGDFAVFEGIAILSYLARHYDPDHKLSFPVDSDDYSVSEQWMGWQHGGLGPMQGQANHMFKFAKEPNPYGAQRYVGESERLYGVLDARLSGRDFVAGPGKGKFSIADISMIGWAAMCEFSGVDLKMFPNVKAWIDRCLARPAVKRGFVIPNDAAPFLNGPYLEKLEKDPEARQKFDEERKYLQESKEKYGYKYSSP
ncbi:hypothetical protein PG999_005154 [Apiospora kogelbergensis]|uniref:Glutathione S-transferase II n=1 Tax=Apiospora kogelbergensis TaxID=1337665 RepID=A0AAW0R199_9PEZI